MISFILYLQTESYSTKSITTILTKSLIFVNNKLGKVNYHVIFLEITKFNMCRTYQRNHVWYAVN